nr:hypothetical protein [Candidatus Freyarchaeota archaeon]
MFESFFSNLSSMLSSVLTILIVVIAINVLCLGILVATGKITVAYLILRDQIRLTYRFVRSITKFFINHWEFASGLILFCVLYIVFYSALPDWAGAYTMQKQLVSFFSSTMISATVVLLAQRKIKWLLRLAPISTASITTIIAIYLYTESVYLVPQLTTQPFPLELLALVLIPSIISIALAKKLHWMVKTRHQSNEAYLNTQSIIKSQNPNSDPDYPDNPDENTYEPTHFSKEGKNRGLTKVEKVYGGKSRRSHNSNPMRQLLESGKKRTKKNYEKLFPEDQWDEDAEGKIEDEDF